MIGIFSIWYLKNSMTKTSFLETEVSPLLLFIYIFCKSGSNTNWNHEWVLHDLIYGNQLICLKTRTDQITCGYVLKELSYLILIGHKACFWGVWTGKRLWYSHCWRCWESWWYQNSVVCVSTEFQKFSLEICCRMLFLLDHERSI